MQNKLDLVNYLPKKIITHDGEGQIVDLRYQIKGEWLQLDYITERHNGAQCRESMILPRWINNSKETWEVLGLLQAECSKTTRSCFTFANNDVEIINKVVGWCASQLDFSKEFWRWYIKINIAPSIVDKKKVIIEQEVVPYWIAKTGMKIERAYPKKVLYSNKSVHQDRAENNYGCFTIEYRNTLFEHIMHAILNKAMDELMLQKKEFILAYLRGIIAGEGTVVFDTKTKHYNVHISACDERERLVYKNALEAVGIRLKVYDNYKETIISRKENLYLLEQHNLLSLHEEKSKKFQSMMQYLKQVEA